MQTNYEKSFGKLIASAIIVSLIFQPIASLAASTDLTDVPLIVQNRVKPNILFTLDNSGSMVWGSITGSDALSEYTSPYDDAIRAGNSTRNKAQVGAKNKRAYYSPTYNKLYYNPAITYLPPVQYDGSATATNFTSSKGASPKTAALIDPYSGGGETVNLTLSCWNGTSPPTLPRYVAATFAIDSTARSNCATSSSTSKPNEFARYAFYYVWQGAVGAENGGDSQNTDSSTTYKRFEIINSNSAFPQNKAASRTDCGTGTTCTYEQEIQNFANWFTYYRTRILTAKSSLGIAFSALDTKSRVGFSTINNNSDSDNTNAANFIALSDFGSTQKNAWYTQLYSIEPGGGTPLPAALDRAGQYFQSGQMPGGAATARTTTVPLACTPNYTILSTDGYWNGALPDVGNNDTTVPTLPANVYVDDKGTPVNDPVAGVPLVAGNNFPAPFYDSRSTENTLADVAMKYWITDLAPATPANRKVAPNLSDPATWQHMVTFTIGLGASGTLSSPPTGSASWPRPVADSATAIDDLWHAALNGHGSYFNANDPAKLQTALASILSNIVNRTGAAASVAVSNPNVSPGDNTAFASTFNSGTWYGDLEAFAIDVNTGLLGSTALWSAQARLDAKAFGTRNIASFDGSAGVPFTAAGLGATKVARLNSPVNPPGTTDNADVISYLRGDRTKEGTDKTSTKPYRTRTHVLGDIVNAEPAYVSAPRSSYTDRGYATFKAGAANRTKVVYQGANDGMLHAFDATTGNELWAYLPGNLLDMNLSATATSTSSLVGLTQQSPDFRHRFYVDGTSIATDVDLSNTQANQPTPPAPNWATVLVGSMGKGGRGYYALNVTDPTAASDAAVASKVMWEFPNANTPAAVRNNIGYSYGTPLNVKTKAAGWVTLVTSGYNNGSDTSGDGMGHLYVLNTATGALISDISTGVGSAATPSGLARISAFLVSPGTDDTADYVYGGDLLGNVWRFDLSADSATGWNVKRLATLVDASGTAQPVTGSPELGVVNTKRMVFVGTGKYLGSTDVPGTDANANASQAQSFYGLLDDKSANPTITPLRTQLVQQTATRAGDNINVTSNPLDIAVKKGWVLDFQNTPLAGERSYTSPVLFQGVLAFTTNRPSADECTPGGSSNLYFLNYKNGGSIPNLSSRFIGDVLASRVQPEGLPDGSVKILVRTSDGKNKVFSVAVPSSTTPTRIMWREVITN